MDHDRELVLEMFRRMTRIRQFELAATNLFKRGQVKGTVHTYIGMEASAVGVCMALRRDDLIAGTHRSHGHNIAKGADVRRMMAEMLGKETGYCHGRGGSMHIAAFETGSLGALGVVGSGIPLAVGAALAFKMRGEDRVAVPFTGDAGGNTGNWHEGLNMASIWSLPVVFVLENNRYGVSTRIEDMVNISDLSIRAAGYGIPGVRVDGFDVIAVYDAARAAVARARARVADRRCWSPRATGSMVTMPASPRCTETAPRSRSSAPGTQSTGSRTCVEEAGIATPDELAVIDTDVAAEIEDAIAFARSSPEPDPATAMDYVYA